MRDRSETKALHLFVDTNETKGLVLNPILNTIFVWFRFVRLLLILTYTIIVYMYDSLLDPQSPNVPE